MTCKRCDELAKELKETKAELKKARRLLQAIATFAQATAQAAAAEMGAGNVPQGRYAYLKAQLETGNAILGMMGLETVKLKKRHKGLIGLGQGLFSGLFGE
jgi:hypothetical protein